MMATANAPSEIPRKSTTSERLDEYFTAMENGRGVAIPLVLTKDTENICKQYNLDLNGHISINGGKLSEFLKFDESLQSYKALVEADFEKKEDLSDTEFKRWYNNQKGSYLANKIFPTVFIQVEQIISVLIDSIEQSDSRYISLRSSLTLQFFWQYFLGLCNGNVSFNGHSGLKPIIPKRAFQYIKSGFTRTLEKYFKNSLSELVLCGTIKGVCIVCLELMNDDQQCQETYCGHRFHGKCLELMKSMSSCPCCNSDLENDHDLKKPKIWDYVIDAKKKCDPKLDPDFKTILRRKKGARRGCIQLATTLHTKLKRLIEAKLADSDEIGNTNNKDNNNGNGDNNDNSDIVLGDSGGNSNSSNDSTNVNFNSLSSLSVVNTPSFLEQGLESAFNNLFANTPSTQQNCDQHGVHVAPQQPHESVERQFGVQVADPSCDRCANRNATISQLRERNGLLEQRIRELEQRIENLTSSNDFNDNNIINDCNSNSNSSSTRNVGNRGINVTNSFVQMMPSMGVDRSNNTNSRSVNHNYPGIGGYQNFHSQSGVWRQDVRQNSIPYSVTVQQQPPQRPSMNHFPSSVLVPLNGNTYPMSNFDNSMNVSVAPVLPATSSNSTENGDGIFNNGNSSNSNLLPPISMQLWDPFVLQPSSNNNYNTSNSSLSGSSSLLCGDGFNDDGFSCGIGGNDSVNNGGLFNYAFNNIPPSVVSSTGDPNMNPGMTSIGMPEAVAEDIFMATPGERARNGGIGVRSPSSFIMDNETNGNSSNNNNNNDTFRRR